MQTKSGLSLFAGKMRPKIMQTRKYGNTDLQLSILGLGGHEFRPDGGVKGFDQGELYKKGGIIFPGFGGENRQAIVARALEAGINLFDVTLDSEKEALGRILQKIRPSQPIVIQARPDGLVYAYDPENRGLADYPRLREEVVKVLKLLQRDCVDIFNFGFLQPALDTDPDYFDKIGAGIQQLKREGLIRYASADTFSGQSLYLAQIGSGHFDSVFINYNLREMQVEAEVLPAAARAGLGFIGREVWMKGQFFQMAQAAELTDMDEAARVALKWNLRKPQVTAAMVGVASVGQLDNALSALENLELSAHDEALISKIRATPLCQQQAAQRRASFGLAPLASN